MSESKPRFTIITVVYNDAKNIKKTIESVLQQTLRDYEYIIVDGLSTDGTIDLINLYANEISEIISEKDKGIYDAMNKGIIKAKGDWILFLNSGDLLYSENVLFKLNESIKMLPKMPAVLYGDVEVLIPAQNIQKVVKTRDLEDIKYVMPFNHQSSLINREIHQNNLYDINYKIVSDYHLFLGLYLKKHTFFNVGFTISTILAGGVSDSGRSKTFYEKRKVHNVYFRNRNNSILYYRSLIRYYMASLVKKIAPKRLVEKIYHNKYK